MNEIKRLMSELKVLEAIATKADEDYENDPENEEFERVANETYSAEYAKREELVTAICGFAPIERAIARKMTFGEYVDKLTALLARA